MKGVEANPQPQSKKMLKIINKLQPYVNGRLITSSFVKYWNELRELVEGGEKK